MQEPATHNGNMNELEPSFDKPIRDPKGRTIEKKGQKKEVYFYTLNFEEPWDSNKANETIRKFISAINSIPEDGVLCPIINTNGIDLSFNVRFTSLIPHQSKLGVQIIVGASDMVKYLIGVFKKFGSTIETVDSLEDAISERERLLGSGEASGDTAD